MSTWPTDFPGPDDAARARAAAAELERFAGETQIAPREELRGRIMAALAAEPTPAPLTALATAAREHRGHAVLAGLRDLWRVAWSGGRPVAIRLSAAAVVALLLVSVGSAGGLAAVGAWNALHPAVTAPAPTPPQQQAPIVVPSAAPSTSPSSSPSPGMSPSPARAASPASSPSMTPTPPPTPRPTPPPSATPMWTHHPGSSYGPGSSCGPQPTSGGMCG